MDGKTILRNVANSIGKRGVGATVRSLAHRGWIRWYEWHYGIRTDAFIELAELGIHNSEFRYYSATDYFAFNNIMHVLDIDPREHVFLDYGAGMGRVMILAATYPFRRVLGVEVAPELTQIARKNIDICRSKFRCKSVEVTMSDASLYEIPPDVSVLYFNNPFYGDTLQAVLGKIHAFAASSSHSVLMVCNVPEASAFEDQILKQAWLHKIREILLPTGRHCLIFTVAPSSASDTTT